MNTKAVLGRRSIARRDLSPQRSAGAPARAATRPFIVTPYRAEDGALVPVVPDRCVAGEPGVGCWIVLDHWRDRKSGPCFPLAVMRCAVHEVAFTLHPCGRVPYGATAGVRPGNIGHHDLGFTVAVEIADADGRGRIGFCVERVEP